MTSIAIESHKLLPEEQYGQVRVEVRKLVRRLGQIAHDHGQGVISHGGSANQFQQSKKGSWRGLKRGGSLGLQLITER